MDDLGVKSPAHLKGSLKPIKLALDLNEVALPWKNMMRLVGNPKRSSDRECKVEEIRQLLNVVSQHLKVAVLVMSSSGMRIGAFEYLNVEHVQPLEVDGKLACDKVLVYEGEGDDEYETLLSKEAYATFQEYVQARKEGGESVTKDSPAIVVRGKTRKCPSGTIRNSLSRFLWQAGLRKTKQKTNDVQVDHGFRKFFDDTAKHYVEKLIGVKDAPVSMLTAPREVDTIPEMVSQRVNFSVAPFNRQGVPWADRPVCSQSANEGGVRPDAPTARQPWVLQGLPT